MNKIKALIITASARKQSNSKAAAVFLIRTLKQRNDLIISEKWVDINKLNISHCKGCEKCSKNLKCKIIDSAAGLLKKIKDADLVIAASPVYFMGSPSRLKAFIDRNLVKWQIINFKPGIQNSKSGKKKKGIIILTAEEATRNNFIGAENEIRAMFAVNDIKTYAALKLPAMHKQGKFIKDTGAKTKVERIAGLLSFEKE